MKQVQQQFIDTIVHIVKRHHDNFVVVGAADDKFVVVAPANAAEFVALVATFR